MAKSATRKSPDTDNLRRKWSFKPDTLDEEQRTVWAVAATETPVRTWYGSEVLRCQRTAIDAGRMKLLPVIDTHDRSSILNTLGQVVEHQIEGRSLLVKIAFADSERGRHAFDLVRSGIVNKVSVGYRIHDYEEQRASDGSTLLTATRWEPVEVSLVSVPADPNATIRGMKMARMTTGRRRAPARDQINDQRGGEMDNEGRSGVDDVDDEQDSVRTRSELRRQASMERQIDELRTQAVRSGLRAADFDDAVENVRSIQHARELVFDLLAERQNQNRTEPGRSSELSGQAAQSENNVIDALAVRLGARSQIANNPLLGCGLIQLGRQHMEEQGVSVRRMDDAQVAELLIGGRSAGFGGVRAAHTTSDFPLLLQAAGQRVLLERYAAIGTPLKTLSSRRDARDFRQQSFIRPGEAPKLLKVLESGEIKHGTLSEDSRGLKIETYARLFALSRQALINDDLGAFSDFVTAFAQSSAETEGDLFFELLSANSFAGVSLSDGQPFFHSSRNNIAASGTSISVASVSLARTAMRLQKNVNGSGTAGVVPAVLMVGPAMETAAEQFVAEINAITTDEVNPFGGKLRLAVENRYSGNGWWLFADPGQRPALMHGYLSGSEGPQVETKNGWEVLGTEFRCVLDFGCGVYDWRAAYFNPGL
jgi:HK97 family phage prohead protease